MFIIVISSTPFSMFARWLHFSWTLILVKNKHIQYASTYWRWSRMVFIKLWRLIQEKYFFISQFFHLSWDVSSLIDFYLICWFRVIFTLQLYHKFTLIIHQLYRQLSSLFHMPTRQNTRRKNISKWKWAIYILFELWILQRWNGSRQIRRM